MILWGETDWVRTPLWENFGEPGPLEPTGFAYPITDFYRTDPISRASQTMAQCSEICLPLQRHPASARTGTDG